MTVRCVGLVPLVALELLAWSCFFERVLVWSPSFHSRPKRWWNVELADGVGRDDMVRAGGAALLAVGTCAVFLP